jgi:hypothetical protein
MGTTFDELLASLHGGSGADLSDVEGNQAITIDAKRQFIIPEGYNLVLAYEGDINSQIVTFKIPTTHEGHNLSVCGLKTLRWRNTSSNVEDWSNLEVVDTNANTTTLKWIVPPAAFATAGNIEIAISIYDLVAIGGKNQIAFSWNTPTYSGFSVGKTLSNVGEGPNIPQIIAPAKNEILFIHEETQSMVAPTGYTFTVTIQGNLNTDYVYFQTTKSLGGIDLTHEDTTISVIVTINKRTGAYVINKNDIATSFADGSQGAGLLSFIWRIPEGISREDKGYTGAFSIVVCVTKENQKWFTTPFDKLQVGKSIVYNTEEAIPVDYYNRIDGDIDTELTPRDVSGIVKHRSALASEIEGKNIEKNEIVVIYNSDGSIRTLAIGSSNSSLKNAKTIETMMLELLENNSFVIDANN